MCKLGSKRISMMKNCLVSSYRIICTCYSMPQLTLVWSSSVLTVPSQSRLLIYNKWFPSATTLNLSSNPKKDSLVLMNKRKKLSIAFSRGVMLGALAAHSNKNTKIDLTTLFVTNSSLHTSHNNLQSLTTSTT